MRAAALPAAVTLASALAGALSYRLAGGTGLVATLSLVTACVVLGIYQLHEAPTAPRDRSNARGNTRSGRRGSDDRLAGYPRLRRIESELAWAAQPGTRYEPSTRRLLSQLVQAALAERRPDGAATDEATARDIVGADAWPYVCPESSPYASRTSPDRDTLTRIVDRLEQL